MHKTRMKSTVKYRAMHIKLYFGRDEYGTCQYYISNRYPDIVYLDS